jgi:hypothetical protein
MASRRLYDKEARNGLRLTVTKTTPLLYSETVSATQGTAAPTRDSGYTVGYTTRTMGTTSSVYHPLFPTVDHNHEELDIYGHSFHTMYLVLRDQLHIVTWLLPLVLYFTVHLQDNPTYKEGSSLCGNT